MKERRGVRESTTDYSRFSGRLAELLIEAAMAEQDRRGRGVLWVDCDSQGMTWRYKGVADCLEDRREWSELEGLLRGYDSDSEVLVAVFDGGMEFFRLPVAARGTAA